MENEKEPFKKHITIGERKVEINLDWEPYVLPLLEIYGGPGGKDPEVKKEIQDHFLQCARVADTLIDWACAPEEEKNNV